MTTCIALLRGVNLAGNKMVAMADLRTCLSTMGFEDVRTVLQSGNMVFRANTRGGAAFEQRLEKAIEKAVGFPADVHVRTAAEWRGVIAANPFPAEAKRDPSRLLVMFLREAPAKARLQALQSAISGPERFRADGRHIYLFYPDGQGDSRLRGSILDKALAAKPTGRNWNTVLKLAALVAS
jgi:uncharacterized protein (DUF1697 family)